MAHLNDPSEISITHIVLVIMSDFKKKKNLGETYLSCGAFHL